MPVRRETLALVSVFILALTACQVAPTPLPPTSLALTRRAPTPSLAPVALTATASVIFLPLIGAPGGTSVSVPLTATPQPPTEPPPAAPTEPPPTPTVPWPPTLVGQTTSKLGAIALNNSDPYFFEFVRRVHPRLIKGINDVSWTWAVKQDSPQTLIIGILGDKQEWWVEQYNPVDAANEYIKHNFEKYQQNPDVNYWEGWNEYNPTTDAQMQWYAQFEATRVCGMQAQGFHAAVGSFAVGWPSTYEQMQLFLPALEAAHRCGGIFAVHEYNGPTMQCGVTTNTPGVIPGAPAFSVPVGTHTLRYRIWYEGLLKPRGLGDLPLVISEAGLDNSLNVGVCGNPGGLGWKDSQGWLVEQGLGLDGPSAYVKVLEWYDEQLRQDAYVIGATLFTAGALEPDNSWHVFDLHDVFVPLANYLATQP